MIFRTKHGQLMGLALVAALAVGCNTTATASGRPSAGGSSPSHATAAAARQTAEPTASAMVAADSANLKGTGSKTGPPVVLSSDYVLADKVVAKAGCHWAFYLDGYDPAPRDDFETAYAGNHSTTSDEGGVELGTYSLTVVANKCGAWSVTLTRP